jgi:TonB family protein
MKITPPADPRYGDELKQNQNRFTKYQVKPPPPTAPKKLKDLSGVKEGARAKGAEGKIGKTETKKKEADPSKRGSPSFDKKAHDLQVIKKSGLVAALARMGALGGGAVSDTFGPGGLGSGVNNALGGTRGRAGLGDAYGVGGMGTRGGGAGGGGNALGIGGLGTKGAGRGRGGYGEVDLGGRGKDETRFVPGKTIIVGGLPREVINRIIQRHYNEIKYCYEKELAKDPGLYGKVAVLFVIDGGGKVGDALVQQTTLSSEPVESCMLNHVRRWTFPAPQGGGTVQVTYPYVFKSTNQ